MASLAFVGLSVGLPGCSLGGSGSAPEITQQPQAAATFRTQSARFDVGVKGKAPLSFQWRRDGVNIAGAIAVQYVTPAVTAADDGAKFSIVITNSKGTVTSNEATLTVYPPPTITTDPQSIAVAVGATAGFTVTGAGQSLTYQWYRDGIVISGATAATFTTAATVAADDGAIFTVDVINGSGRITSAPATLTVLAAAAIVTPPASQTVNVGQPAIFSVLATGGNLVYQWRRNGADIAGAMSAVYTTPAATLADSGVTYSVVVVSAAGSATSTDATLTVVSLPNAAPPALPAEVSAGRSPNAAVSFVLVRKQDGTLFEWGDNSAGQGGRGTTSTGADTPTAVTLPAGLRVVQVAAGAGHGLALLDNGVVYSWGLNASGQLGLDDQVSRLTPVAVTLPPCEPPVPCPAPLPAVAIAAGLQHSVAVLNDGRVYAWGNNVLGQVGTGPRQVLNTRCSDLLVTRPCQVTGISTAVSVTAGNDHTLALLADGTVVAWGANSAGQLGNGGFKLSRVPVATGAQDVARVRAGGDMSMAITNRRAVLAWGRNADSQLGLGASFTNSVATPTGVIVDAVDAAASNRLLLIVGSDGLVRGAGANETGSLGDGTTTARATFTAATVLTNVLTVASGGQSFSLALKADGSVFAWGDNAARQLGNSTLSGTGTPTPTQVPGFDAIP